MPQGIITIAIGSILGMTHDSGVRRPTAAQPSQDGLRDIARDQRDIRADRKGLIGLTSATSSGPQGHIPGGGDIRSRPKRSAPRLPSGVKRE